MKGRFILKTLSLCLAAAFALPVFAACAKVTGTTGRGESSSPSSGGQTTPAPSTVATSSPSSGTLLPVTAPVTALTGDPAYAAMTDIELSRYAGAEGMILLENKNGALPIAKGAKVAVFGGGQVDFIKGGTGSGDVNALYTVNLLDGLRAKEKEGKLSLYAPLSEAYEKNTRYTPDDEMYENAAREADTAIVVISRNSGENVDLTASQFVISTAERTLLRKVTDAGFAHVAVVLNVGTVMDTSFMKSYEKIDALLVCWQPGMEGGNSTADVLTGDVNPSGKTVDTWAASYGAYPSSKVFASGAEYAVYSEDIFVGYRYFETFDREYQLVNYPFGYGLSYTTFELSGFTAREDDTYIETRVTVKNTGTVAGKEVVQVYFSCPDGKLGAPGKALAAFAKTKLLAPGESEELVLTFAIADMAMYDDTGKIERYAYVLEKGDYNVYAGNSVKDAGSRAPVFTHSEESDRTVWKLDGKIAPTTLQQRLTASGEYETLDASGYGTDLHEGVTVISALDYLIQNSQAVCACSSDGTVCGMDLQKGNTLVFSVNAPAAGNYTLTLRAAVPGKAESENALTLNVNGERSSLSVKGTGGRYALGEISSLTLSLNRGANLLRLTVNSSFTASLLLSALVFDDGSGKGTTDLAAFTPQSTEIAQGEKIDFTEVYDDPSKLEAFLLTLTPSEMIHLLCGHAPNVGHGDGSLAGIGSRKVPYIDTSDGPAGLDLAVKQVAWPIETALASTWNTTLIYNVGQKIGEECFAAGVDVWLAPGINIHRDPLGGRNFEYFSEDPLVSGKMASAITQGVQSVDGVGVMIKHLYANSRESGRVDGNSSISERAARMIYLRSFEICIKEASPWSVMTTYNSTNGRYNAENEALLNGVLREEWGFTGFLCTDWGAHSEQFREILAGNDAKMSWGYPDSVLAAYKCGYLPLDALRASARRLLEAALKSGSLYRSLHPVIHTHTVNGTTRVKAAEITSRSEGIGFEECLDEDGGIIPNYCQSGRALTYTLKVTKPGSYGFIFRVASDNKNSDFTVYLDGRRVGRFRWTEGSAGWQNWVTVESALKANLTEGEHELKLEFGTALNLNWFELTEQS